MDEKQEVQKVKIIGSPLRAIWTIGWLFSLGFCLAVLTEEDQGKVLAWGFFKSLLVGAGMYFAWPFVLGAFVGELVKKACLNI